MTAEERNELLRCYHLPKYVPSGSGDDDDDDVVPVGKTKVPKKTQIKQLSSLILTLILMEGVTSMWQRMLTRRLRGRQTFRVNVRCTMMGLDVVSFRLNR